MTPHELIVISLNLFPEVAWDRWAGEPKGRMSVFGWIARQDGKFDFMRLVLWRGQPMEFTTSSARYSAEFSQRLSFSHADCKRVVHHFPRVRCVHEEG